MELQHCVATIIARILQVEEEDYYTQLWIIYGVEVVINELSKIIVALGLGLLMHSFWETVFTTVVLILLRNIAGGRHFKNNVYCFVSSVLAIILPVGIGYHISISMVWIIVLMTMVGIGLVVWTPYEKNQIKTILMQKKKLLVVLSYIGAIIFEIMIFGNTRGIMTIAVAISVCIFLVPVKKKKL